MSHLGGISDHVGNGLHVHEHGIVERRAGIGELRRHGEFVPIEFDRVVARHADAGSCNDLAALERAVELRCDPRGDHEVGIGVESDDLTFSSQHAAANDEIYVCSVISSMPSAFATSSVISLVK